MLRYPVTIILFLLIHTGFVGQSVYDCEAIREDQGVDIMVFSENALSIRTSHSSMLDSSAIVFCPAGIRRSSDSDIKKRWSFDWSVKYNNVYLRTRDGLVLEGLNEHGFSASLMYLENSQLPKKDKELLPIAASLAVNFFIDHFKSIDTALLAVWDTRIFDDLKKDCAWPFRIILHDSTGATAYIEHIGGALRVFTPEAPAIICGGLDYSRLITLRYLKDSLAGNAAERDFLYFSDHIIDKYDNAVFIISDRYDGKNYFLVTRMHANPAMIITNGQKKYEFILKETQFKPGSETSKPIF